MAMERSTVVGVFHDRADAERAIEELHSKGFHDDQIGFAVRGADGASGATTTETGSKSGEGLVGGILAGAGVGGVIAAAAALLIPGFGPVVAGGILATVLGGAAIGAAAGGILGALVGMGVPEEEAHYYEGEFNEGRILVTVKADGRYQEARDILRREGAYDIENRGGATTRTATTTAATTTPRAGTTPVRSEERDRMQLREEELHVRKDMVETGEVSIGKEVVTEHKQIDVPVRREEVVIERHPVEGHPAQGNISDSGEIRVPVREEQVRLEKQPVVYEEVGIGKRAVEETEHVSGEVRREEARIEHEGDVPMRGGMSGTGTGTWDTVSPRYRQTWQTRYGTSGGRWEDYEPGYRYGYEMAADPRYQNRDWAQVEAEMGRDYGTWAQRSGYKADPNAWDRFKMQVHEAWDDRRGMRRAA